jgi:hypothetical protein
MMSGVEEGKLKAKISRFYKNTMLDKCKRISLLAWR